MSKKNDIRLSKRENHRLPDSGVRGLLNQLKKEEKNKDAKSLEILKAKKNAVGKVLGDMTWGALFGILIIAILPSLNTAPYWIALFLSIGFINLFKLSAEHVSREDYIPSWKEKDGK